MPIVSSSILRVINKPNGIAVYEQHTDHTGKIHDYRYRTTSDADKDANLAQHAITVFDGFLSNEAERVTQDIKSGNYDSRSDYLDRIENIRAVVKGAMSLPAEKALVIAAIGDTVTDAELEQAFDVDTRIKIRDRITSVLSLQSQLEADIALQVEL